MVRMTIAVLDRDRIAETLFLCLLLGSCSGGMLAMSYSWALLSAGEFWMYAGAG